MKILVVTHDGRPNEKITRYIIQFRNTNPNDISYADAHNMPLNPRRIDEIWLNCDPNADFSDPHGSYQNLTVTRVRWDTRGNIHSTSAEPLGYFARYRSASIE